MPPYHAILAAGAMLIAMHACNAQPAPIELPAPDIGRPTVSSLRLTIADVKGSYTIPYIQSAPELLVAVKFAQQGIHSARVEVLSRGEVLAQA